jgi:hypothetical protein
VRHSTSTIRKYLVSRRGPRGGQTWKTFIKNHASQFFAVDILTQYTAVFTTVSMNHFIFLNREPVRRVCAEYKHFCNGARPAQALHAIPEPHPELSEPPPTAGKLVALPVLGGVQHDYRRAA